MKILMIAPTPFFADRGCHVRIYEEIKALQNLGHDVILCTYGLGRDMPEINIIRTISFPWYKKLSAGPTYTKILLLPFLAITVIKACIKFKPDIIHAHLHEGALIARLVRVFFRKQKYIFDMQGYLSKEILQHGFVKEKGLMYKFFCWLEKKILTWQFVITSSDTMLGQLYDFKLLKNRCTSIQDGVDTNFFKPQKYEEKLARDLNIDKNKPCIIFMGLLETYQGVDKMIEAFSYVYKKNSNVTFIIIGYPNIEKYSKMCDDFGLSECVKFLGKVNYLDMPKYLSLADIAIAPKISATENDGKIYNYMAMGLPTIAFERDVSKSILKSTGIYAKFNDSLDLAEKIIWAINNTSECKNIGIMARERAVKYLSWIEVGKKIESVYKVL